MLVVLVTIICLVPLARPRASRAAEASVKTAGPLAEYVNKEDKSYAWTKRQEGSIGSGKYAELTLTSQTWKDIVWKHQLFVYRPAETKSTAQALLWIHGGRWADALAEPPKDGDKAPQIVQLLATVGDQLRCPVAVLLHVPQQPIFDGMVEDEAISHTFVRFYATGDAEWPLLLPMVKSAVRAMDAVQEFASQSWSIDVKNFTVTGASKRGWTTWLTSAVDPRVTALAPMVIDVLNMGPQMKLQVESFGEYSEQIADYTEKGLQKLMDTPHGQKLTAIVDPYTYRDVIRQPKLIMLGTNDRYWPLDALNVYWDDLVGEKYVLYVPNNGHGLKDYPRIFGTLNALNQHVTKQRKLPQLDWEFVEKGQTLALRIKSDVKPSEVQVWTAAANTRDFREAKFSSSPTKADGDQYLFHMPLPEKGFAALLGEAVFAGDPAPFYLSTNVRIVKGKESPPAESK
jgi:PhoPQ-activated pathogenicity-related protein